MTKREERVINAFINCVRAKEYSFDYAVLLIEDNQRFGWLSDEAKDVFYSAVETPVSEDEGPEEEDSNDDETL